MIFCYDVILYGENRLCVNAKPCDLIERGSNISKAHPLNKIKSGGNNYATNMMFRHFPSELNEKMEN